MHWLRNNMDLLAAAILGMILLSQADISVARRIAAGVVWTVTVVLTYRYWRGEPK